MTKSEMDYLDTSLLGPFLLFMNQYFNYLISEKYLLYFSLVCLHMTFIFKKNHKFQVCLLVQIWTTFDLWRYCSKVCQEICDSLNIYLFKIPNATLVDISSKNKTQSVPIVTNTSTRTTRTSTRK